MSAEPHPAARDTPQGELHNVVAKVIYPNRVDPNGLRDLSIQAELEPGPFTIPKGYVFTKLRYHFADPKTGFEHDKVTATTIYSVTEHRYVKEAKNNPEIVLPAGEYKVVCGGLPEATGVLTYTLIREDLVKKTDDVVKSTPTKTPGGKPTTDDLSKTRESIGSGGGEGKRKVTVFKKGTRVFTDSAVKDPHFEGAVDAVLTIAGDSFTLEFPLATKVPNIKTFSETWKGRINMQQQPLSVSGTVLETIIYASGGHVKGPGTFHGTLDENRLTGTMEKNGEWDGGYGEGPRPFRETVEWSIKDFVR